MKKKYTYLILVLGFFFSAASYGQIINAVNDNATVAYSGNVQIAIQNALGNDTYNGIPVTLSQVTITQISASANISLQPNGSVVLDAGANSGTYNIYYSICDNVNTNNCDYAEISVLVTPVPIIAGNDAVTISTGLTAPQVILENILSTSGKDFTVRSSSTCISSA